MREVKVTIAGLSRRELMYAGVPEGLAFRELPTRGKTRDKSMGFETMFVAAVSVAGTWVLTVARDITVKVMAERVSKHLERLEAKGKLDIVVDGVTLPPDIEARRQKLLELFEKADSQ